MTSNTLTNNHFQVWKSIMNHYITDDEFSPELFTHIIKQSR